MYSSFKAAYNNANDKLKKLLDDSDFTYVLAAKMYQKAYEMAENIGGLFPLKFTALLLDAGIDPLPYMETIVDYMYSNVPIMSINIPNNIKSIGRFAFENCASLESVSIPNSVMSIGAGAFLGCSSLQPIIIPNSVTSIGDYAFEGCEFLTTITYLGTKDNWKKIKKSWLWNMNSKVDTIHCTDCDIKLK